MSVTPSDAVDDVEETGDEDAAPADGGSGSPTRSFNLSESLFSTSPERPLQKVESPFDPERGGPRRVYRGIQKMTDVDGLPAIADVLLGLAEIVVDGDLLDGGQGEDESTDQGEGDQVDDPLADLDVEGAGGGPGA